MAVRHPSDPCDMVEIELDVLSFARVESQVCLRSGMDQLQCNHIEQAWYFCLGIPVLHLIVQVT